MTIDDWSLDDAVYDGPAELATGGSRHRVRIRVTGRVDPIDGRYHWQGTLFAPADVVKPSMRVALTVDGHTADGRITEQTPWGTYAVTGAGVPPFAFEEGEIDA